MRKYKDEVDNPHFCWVPPELSSQQILGHTPDMKISLTSFLFLVTSKLFNFFIIIMTWFQTLLIPIIQFLFLFSFFFPPSRNPLVHNYKEAPHFFSRCQLLFALFYLLGKSPLFKIQFKFSLQFSKWLNGTISSFAYTLFLPNLDYVTHCKKNKAKLLVYISYSTYEFELLYCIYLYYLGVL